MKRNVSVAVVALFVLAWAALHLAGATLAQAPASRPPEAVAPNPAGSVVGQAPVAGAPSVAPLDCQGCHEPGKQLPYLGGALFHADAHSAYDDGYHAKRQNDQVGSRAATCVDCHTTNGDLSTMRPARDPASSVHRSRIAITCGRCHSDPNIMRGSGISETPFLTYQESVHARALSQGNLSAAVCTDCHRAHDVLPALDARSPIFKYNIPQTCGNCHASITQEFSQSVHGQAAARGVSQTPVCTDCHGIHSILPHKAAQATLRTNTCAKCHEGVRLAQEFGIQGQRVASYEDSYHGLAKRLGSEVAADCASCHGVHNILPSSDPRSLIAPANLSQTCGQCHAGAGANFALGKVHLDVPISQDTGSVGVRWVRVVYLGIIWVTIGGMVAHNALVWRKKAAEKLRSERRTIVRMTASQRAQHWLLLVSFVTLVVTGFALVYPEAFLGLGVDEEMRRLIHRIAAVAMIAVGIYHVVYAVATAEGRKWVRDMVPTIKDVRDAVQAVRHYAGGRVEKPKFLRFGYVEKAEYWAVVWGTVVMGLTGLMIWFKVGWFGFLPRWWIDIAIAVHFYEAVLATLAILVWHIYSVVFDPDVYPINYAFWDGRMSEALYREEHELDYERMKASDVEGDEPSEDPKTDAAGGTPLPEGTSD